MKSFLAIMTVLATGLMLTASDSSRAQQAAQENALQARPQLAQQDAQPDASVETSRFDNWTVRCVTSQERRCQIFQQITVQQDQRQVPFMSVTLSSERIRIQVPPGLALRDEVRLSAGGFETAIPYTVCTQQGCFAGDPTAEPMIEAFRQGDVLKVTLGRLQAEPLVLDVSLIGFSQAYAKMQEN